MEMGMKKRWLKSDYNRLYNKRFLISFQPTLRKAINIIIAHKRFLISFQPTLRKAIIIAYKRFLISFQPILRKALISAFLQPLRTMLMGKTVKKRWKR